MMYGQANIKGFKCYQLCMLQKHVLLFTQLINSLLEENKWEEIAASVPEVYWVYVSVMKLQYLRPAYLK